ncbi:AAA family ATPase [Streptomyces marincola]|uniref:AAA family ATPase n=1 Tax=Streptomyces marincola TaxID=2878388 RepID=UPI001CF26046|nr:LuxR family transcriptional regulator [Streptomyces marincola]UCM91510.1 AAA family ATPase [Streptomyces marincola]
MTTTQRETVLARLCTAFDACDNRLGGSVRRVVGAVGSGKTTLLEAFNDHTARRGSVVMSAIGSRAERDLPLGVLSQLVDTAGLSRESARRMTALLGRVVPEEAPPRPNADGTAHGAGGSVTAPAVHELFMSLLDLAKERPLVVTVDDAHHADDASLHCLMYAIRRLRCKRIMVVLTESPTLRDAHPLFHAELQSQPHFAGLTLGPLPEDALGAPAEEPAGDRPGLPPAGELFALTGGSPLLLRGLIDEEPGAGPRSADTSASRPGGPFDQAVLRCLYRHEPEVRATARALAVLRGPASPQMLAHLTGLETECVTKALGLLRMCGLAGTDRIRHPRIARAVLADLPAEESRRLHRAAATYLQEHGGEPEAVAGHLVHADWAEPSWAVATLHEAARQAMAKGRPDLTGDCLRLAARANTGASRHADMDALLIRCSWQINPLSVTAQLDGLREAVAAGRAQDPAAAATVPLLLWHGRADTAKNLLTAFAEGDGPNAADGRLRAVRLLTSLAYPDQLAEGPERGRPVAGTGTGTATSAAGRQIDAVALLADALIPERAGRDVATTAERMVQRYMAEPGALGTLTAPLVALLCSGMSDLVNAWTRVLLDRPQIHRSPVWKGILHAIRAEAALRLGRLGQAEEQARAALREVPLEAWGVAAAAPLATLITAATESQLFMEANQWLARPLPADTFRTPLGLHYLAARARFHAATGRPQAAADDLRWCGETMRKWGMDTAGLVPWRLELARVLLGAGDRAEGTRLLREQLAEGRGADQRTRGATLRLLAAEAPAAEAEALLTEAVDVLENCGDRLELARATADLGDVLRRGGDADGARGMFQRAQQLAQSCGSPRLAQQLARAGSEPAACPPEGHSGDGALSQAQLRVAVLAAEGHTNREISRKLFITVSTVEQHLTRIYRKLNVKQRDELAHLLSSAHAGAVPREA